MNKVSSNVLNQKTDSTLLDEVQSLVRKEKEIVVEVINYLKEIESRQLHLARGYSSLFTFCTEFLGYSEAEAHIRIQAARLTQALPEVSGLIESGEISLSVAAAAQSHFRRENLRRKEIGTAKLSIQEKREALTLITGNSRREAEQNLNTHFAQPSRKTLTFNADQELADKIEKLMDLMAHQNFDRDLGKMVELLVNEKLARIERAKTLKKDPSQSLTVPIEIGSRDLRAPLPPRTHLIKGPKNEGMQGNHYGKRKGACEKSTWLGFEAESGLSIRGNLDARSKKAAPRYISRSVRTLVWTKYEGRCAYIDPQTRKFCGNKHGVQIDHVHPFSKGGSNNPENLTLLCSSHNRWKGTRIMKPTSPP